MAINSTNPSIRVTFCGAAGTVTGSKYLVEFDDKKILVDCGLFQGKKELRLRNWDNPPFEPSLLSAIVLTHAHVDHSAYLPLVVKRGYTGPIYCTPATKKLLELILPDSAHLQEEEADFANRHGTSRHHPAKPLYTTIDAESALSQIKTFPSTQPLSLLPGCTVFATLAGHILGAVTLSLEIHGKRITFSGDVGRYDTPILPDPQPHDLGELLICESTYGDRLHDIVNIKTEFIRVIQDAVHRRGPLIIPAFAVGRTQLLLYYLAELEREGKIPGLPVYVDSPMAVDATSIYSEFKNDYDDDALKLIASGILPLRTRNTYFCRSVEESKRLNTLTGPRIIIAASGMITGGRVLHHMLHSLSNEDTTVLFVGYQAEGTRGQIIQSGAPEVRIFGKNVSIRAHRESISGFSAHGDRDELLRWLRSCRGTPQQVKIVHGEPPSATAFSEAIRNNFQWRATPAQYLETVEI